MTLWSRVMFRFLPLGSNGPNNFPTQPCTNGGHKMYDITSVVDDLGLGPVGPLVMVAMYLTMASVLYQMFFGLRKPHHKRAKITNRP
jgi:hypothetical protein